MPKCIVHPEEYRNFGHSRAKAIAAHCLECSGDSRFERKKCPAKGCALWAFRLGYEINEDGTRRNVRKGQIKAILDAGNDFEDEDEELLDQDE